MKLLQEILREAGFDAGLSFTVAPKQGGYFKAVKRVEEYTPEKIVLAVAGGKLTVSGEKLSVDKYFQQDLLLRGNITGVNFE